MGAWGYLPFENDDALDWREELEAGGADVIRQALAMAVKAGERVAGEKSELAELCDDADEPEWRESLDDLTEQPRVALR